MTTLNQLTANAIAQFDVDSATLTALKNAAAAWAAVAGIDFREFRLDSRQVQAGDVFVLLKSQSGNQNKSQDYLKQVADKAAFVLSELDVTFDTSDSAASSMPICYVPNLRAVLGTLIQTQQQQVLPVALPNVVAVTGTNGKTTISQLVAQLCDNSGLPSAIMGTAGNGRLGQLVQASHTTGDVLAVQSFLHQMGQQQVAVLALEASSHGLDQQRLQGVPVSVAIYSNLSRDHLDYHADMADYAAAKSKLFNIEHFPSLTHAIINLDDDHASVMQDMAIRSGLTIWTYSLCSERADFFAKRIEPSLAGVEIVLQTPQGELQLHSPLLGRFNVANVLAAIAGALALGVDVQRMPELVRQLKGANGRMQRVPSEAGCFIVDYAHTPDALTQVLTSLKAHCEGQLWAVFGCGGDRDKGKRPLMAQAGLAVADHVVLTSDNPRSEDPLDILEDMQKDMSSEQQARTHVEPDRRKAIAYAVASAGEQDIVVIAGKGHETYQEIKGVRYDFDDSQVLAQAL